MTMATASPFIISLLVSGSEYEGSAFLIWSSSLFEAYNVPVYEG